MSAPGWASAPAGTKNTWATLELPVGSIEAYGIQAGSVVTIK